MEGKILEAYVTNLGKYNEGRLVGAPLNFPATTEDVQSLLKRIGVDGVRYEEIFITNFESDILGLYDHLGEYESIDELNHLAHLLSGMDDNALAKLEAVMDSGECTGSVKDLINLTQNLDSYEFYPDIENEEDLGRLYIQELDAIQVPERLIDYIDYEAYGGMCGSTRAATLPLAAMSCVTTALSWSITTALTIFPGSIAFSPIPSSISGSRWRPIKK